MIHIAVRQITIPRINLATFIIVFLVFCLAKEGARMLSLAFQSSLLLRDN